jgi:hypothetical protein
MRRLLWSLVLACAVAAIAAASVSPAKERPLNPYTAKYERSMAAMATPDQALDGVMAASADIALANSEAALPQSKSCSRSCSTSCSKTCTTTRGCSSQCKVQTDGCGGSSGRPAAPGDPVNQPATGALPPSNIYFSLGSTEAEVQLSQGDPDKSSPDRWEYRYSSVTFLDGLVVGFSNISNNLRVRMTPKALTGATEFAVGSTPDEVLGVQGTPDKVKGDTWEYRFSSVTFKDGVVLSYSDPGHTLKVRPVAPVAPAAHSEKPVVYFSLGSTEAEVQLSQGDPDKSSPDRWEYRYSSVTFHEGVVIGFSNISKNLRVRMTPKTRTGATMFAVGSTPDEVLEVQGTPDKVKGDTWEYKFSSVTFGNGFVASYSDPGYTLKVR